MQPDPLAGQQVVVHRLAEQRVPEGVARALRHQHVHLDRLAQRLLEHARLDSGGSRQQAVGDPAAGDAGRPDDLAGGVVEPVEADEQEVGEVGRHPTTGATGRSDELLDEERVALGAVDDVGDLGVADGLGVQLVDERAHVGGRERVELEPIDAADARPLGDLGAQRVATVQVVGAVGRHDPDRTEEGPGEQEAEHVAGRLVGPVGVLDDEQHRRLLGNRLEDRVHRLEQVTTVKRGALAVVSTMPTVGQHPAAGLEPTEGGVGVGNRRDDVGQVGGQPAQHLGEREVGQRAVAEVEAVPREHLPALGEREVAQLGEQSGLADAGVTGQQDGVGHGEVLLARRTNAEQRSDLRQLGVASYQMSVLMSGRCHVTNHRSGHRQSVHSLCLRAVVDQATFWAGVRGRRTRLTLRLRRIVSVRRAER